ncbi:MAG: NAD-dependent epimerase/dehydratase family protein [Parcubacteria group bacterium]|nr:NAD-dependent epimerase/dehydratase family protein [Parcubacteria group bacterium]
MNEETSLKKKRVFVTGASGKIGKKLLIQLLKNDYSVVAMVRNKSNLLTRHPSLRIIEADILELKKYYREIRECNYVYHLAAYQNISDSSIDNFLKVNVEGTSLILEATLNSKVKKIIYISTIMVFKPQGTRPVDEKSPKKNLGNRNYYVETKLLALKTIEKFKTKVPIVTLYPTIVIDLKDVVSKGNKLISGWQGFLWKIIGGGVPGGLMCMVGNKNRMMNYILMDNLVATMINTINREKTDNDYILGGENTTVENYLQEALRVKGRIFLPIRFPMFLLKIISMMKVFKINLIDFIVNNPPEDICANSQRAINDLGLEITRLETIKRNTL